MEALPDWYRGDRAVSPATKAGLIEFIEEARVQARNHVFAERCTEDIRADLCDIPASEVDAWLKTLPAVEQV